MRILKCILMALGLLSESAFLYASETVTQFLRFDHITVEDGLSHSWVFCVLKDSRGFIWFGTAAGLDRYDGYSFTTHHFRPNDSRSLASPRVRSLFEDTKGRLWLGSAWYGAGLARYDRATDTFHYFPLHAPPNGLGATGVSVIYEDRQGMLWLGTENGLRSLDADKEAFKRYHLDSIDTSDQEALHVDAILEDSQGRFWVGTGHGLVKFDRRSGDSTRIPLTVDPPIAAFPDVQDICETSEGHLWIATLGAGLFWFDPESGRTKRYMPIPGDPASLSHRNVTRLAMGAPGTLYVGTENGGLNVLDLSSETFSSFMPDPDDAWSLNSASIWSLLFDDQGILWIGTFNGGVNILSPLGQRFGLIRAGRGQLSDPHVTAVLEDSHGILWVGTDSGGLNRLDRSTGRFSYYRHDPLDTGSLGSDAVIMLHEDGQRRLWVGAYEGGLNLFDPRTNRFIRYRHDPGDSTSIASDTPWCILEETPTRYLVGTNRGVDVFDPKAGRFSRLADRFPGLPIDYVHRIARDHKGNLWVAMAQCAGYIDVRSHQAIPLAHDPDDPRSIGRGAVRTLYVDSRDNVWFGTEGGGLSCIPSGNASLEFVRFTTDHGLPGNGILSIVEDAMGNLWLGTDRGLSRFENAVALPDAPRFLNFDTYDGLQGLAFHYGAVHKSRRGELFFGGERGLNYFYPADIKRNPNAPPVVVTGLKLFNEPAGIGVAGSPLTADIVETRRLTFSPRHTVMTFEFAALNFLLPMKNRYAYKLEGFDRDWNFVGMQRSATYTNLPPGSYVFRARGSNNDGVWNTEGASLEIHVLPPFWKTSWFRLAIVAMLAAALTMAYGSRIRSLKARERELERRVKERTAALQQEIAERERAEDALKSSEERYALAARGTNDGIWDWDLKTDRIFFSPRWKEMLGYGGAEIGDLPYEWLGRVHPDDAVRLKDSLAAYQHGPADHFEDEHRVRHRDGGFRWVLCRGFAVRDAVGSCERLVGALSDITERRVYDPLTCLPNRTFFVERLTYALSRRHEKGGGARLAVLILDLDRFKMVNDSFGHLMGDQLLVEVARRVERTLKPSGLLARFGGDEFAILLEGVGNVDDVVRVAGRIQEALRAPCMLGSAETFVSATAGIALSAEDNQRAEEMIRDASTALHRAKAEGPRRIVVFDASMRIAVVETLRLESALQRALENGELRFHYQPIVSLPSGAIAGFEALARWQHPERGLIFPVEFIPLTEKTGLISRLGRQALHSACRQMREWQLQYERARSLFVSVNISPRQFTHPDLIHEIRAALRESQLPPQSLRIEITESTLLEGDDRVLATLERLRELHVAVDVDDFGTGYSSLSYLQNLPVDALKIDRVFVGRMGFRDDSLSIVQTVLNLAKSLGLSSVAEGVETQDQYDCLKRLGCQLAQGLLISPAVEPEVARSLLDAMPFTEQSS